MSATDTLAMSTLKVASLVLNPKRPPPNRIDSWSSTAKLRQSNVGCERYSGHRQSMPSWKWWGTIVVICFTSMISGYDVSNVANIQPRLYEALGHIELLEWITLSYSLAVFAVLSLARKIVYCFNLRSIYLVHLLIFILGSALAGAASHIATVIVGRSIMGLGGAVILQTNMAYLAEFANSAETPTLIALSSASWAVGLAIGGPLGSAFAEKATWRWAFYLNIPLVASMLFLSALCLPQHRFYDATSSVWHRLRHGDPLGILFNAIVPELFAIAVTFGGPIWEWDSAPSTVTWVLFGLTLMTWMLQQYLCIFTTTQERALPVHLLSRTDLLPIWIATACAGSAYAITLIYTPLFFAFVKGADALAQSVRLLPFTFSFILALMVTGRLLPIIQRYKLVYVAAGLCTMAGSLAMATSLSKNGTAEALVMGLEVLLGIGLGLHFQHGVGISNVINKNRRRDRMDSVAMCNFAQFGGIAITLAIAGSIFQNVGYQLLADAMGDKFYSKSEIREALAGVSSTVWQDPGLLQNGVMAVSDVLSKEFYIALSAGSLCLVCGILMRSGKLNYQDARVVHTAVIEA